jgi:hypothetical protein
LHEPVKPIGDRSLSGIAAMQVDQWRLHSLLIFDAAFDAAMSNDYDAFLNIRAADLQSRGLALAGESDVPAKMQVAAPPSEDDSDTDPSD